MSLDPRTPLDPPGIIGAVLDALVEPVLLVGAAGIVERVNIAAVHVLGADRDLGRPITEHLARVDVPPVPPLRGTSLVVQALVTAGSAVALTNPAPMIVP